MSIQDKQVSYNMCFKPMRSDVVKRHMKQHNKRKCDEMDKQDEKYIKEEICDEAANGNFIIHKKGCTCCKRMINGISEYTSTVTGEKYKIDGYYTCETSNCIYLVTCGICHMQYVGKTIRSMRKRHAKHRDDIKANIGGLGAHFLKHAEEIGIDMESNMEDIMQYFKLIILTDVDKYSTVERKDMEASMMQTMKTTQEYGGINIRLERKQDQKQWKCDQCDFRANRKKYISKHNKRDHSDYKVLCDQCGYITKNKSNLKRHFKAKHPEYL